jgi:hypothetical protein
MDSSIFDMIAGGSLWLHLDACTHLFDADLAGRRGLREAPA